MPRQIQLSNRNLTHMIYFRKNIEQQINVIDEHMFIHILQESRASANIWVKMRISP